MDEYRTPPEENTDSSSSSPSGSPTLQSLKSSSTSSERETSTSSLSHYVPSATPSSSDVDDEVARINAAAPDLIRRTAGSTPCVEVMRKAFLAHRSAAEVPSSSGGTSSVSSTSLKDISEESNQEEDTPSTSDTEKPPSILNVRPGRVIVKAKERRKYARPIPLTPESSRRVVKAPSSDPVKSSSMVRIRPRAHSSDGRRKGCKRVLSIEDSTSDDDDDLPQKRRKPSKDHKD